MNIQDLAQVKLCFERAVPALSHTLHKGQSGRLGIIGGSKIYTGAPYFAGISALRCGADLVHIFCEESAAIPIKSYSPELMVHPILDTNYGSNYLFNMIGRVNAFVIGPGLGRGENTFDTVDNFLKTVPSNIPTILDGDALYLLSKRPLSLSNTIITPNIMEYKRLYQNIFGNEPGDSLEEVSKLSIKLGCTVIKKGEKDIVFDGYDGVIVTEKGSPRRCGGQGDILAGIAGLFALYTNRFTASVGAATVLKRAARMTYQNKGREMVTSDICEMIGKALTSVLEPLI